MVVVIVSMLVVKVKINPGSPLRGNGSPSNRECRSRLKIVNPTTALSSCLRGTRTATGHYDRFPTPFPPGQGILEFQATVKFRK